MRGPICYPKHFGIDKIILMATIVLAIFSFLLVSPNSMAANSDTSVVTTTVEPVISIVLDTDDLVFNFSSLNDTGTFSSSPIVATVTTNSAAGYALYFSSSDDSTDLTNSNSSITDVISSDFSGTVTSETMQKNNWGYSLDNVNFSKIPLLSNQVKIKDISTYPTEADKNTSVYIGVKVASDLTSGEYQDTIKFTALAH